MSQGPGQVERNTSFRSGEVFTNFERPRIAGGIQVESRDRISAHISMRSKSEKSLRLKFGCPCLYELMISCH